MSASIPCVPSFTAREIETGNEPFELRILFVVVRQLVFAIRDYVLHFFFGKRPLALDAVFSTPEFEGDVAAMMPDHFQPRPNKQGFKIQVERFIPASVSRVDRGFISKIRLAPQSQLELLC